MNTPPLGLLDLSAHLAEVKDKEAAVVLTADGRILASDFDSAGRKAAWLEDVLELAKTMTSLLEDSSVSGLDRGLLEGSKRKLVVQRSSKLGIFVVIVGRETMNVGPAESAAKKISIEIESALGSKK
jgi:predicted regulator of Ras-like GTPase activity (Roadblock/LC7/MglB family)